MAGEPDYANYTRCMEEIKRRQIAIDEILYERKTTSFKYTNIEFVALQFRKIFELVILATLTSHQHLFEGLTRKLAKEWQVTKIVVIVKSKNPGFFPNPIDRVPSTNKSAKDEWKPVSVGFLTLDELVEAHGKIGTLMHANNPYREEQSLNELESLFPSWRERLIRLLNHHLIKFPDDETILYVGMQSAETGSVHTALFKKQA
ncbi:hypothetical protein L6654_18220 [Bradyrhizobium sp. WYCCWR 13023]|uniref:Uncharacterized protein n=1 Tax=Bradyrhizobium zhengyangense TaxID=2911009 RepID=A0A9X1RBI8_9BRAD|nr:MULTISPECIES: hypothetical protein [Bradyrhizobium]MCG2628572.1 hypothetical protein [Bradyrhizobium zhengyangense]MCG2644104.1 hypothetical protein [Bradyrhizobium zhengyangense]MDA9524387.1 hypothetical protein [Bradyrhizobium sp. CCBAU 11434]